ncbi:MAG TPA: o-succinylbenzoate synthase [Gryllotalpicola sp.]
MTLRIDQLSLHRVRLPLVHGFQTSSHRKNHLEHILVRAVEAGGAVAWGEIAVGTQPYFSSESTDSAWAVARDHLAPALLGAEWEHPHEVEPLWRRIRGNYFAKAGFDMAAWALWSGASGIPLAAALGGTRDTVEAGVSLGIEPSIDALLEQVGQHVEAGYGRVKLKIAPGWESEPVRAVRAAFPAVRVHVDANAVYGPGDVERLVALDGLGLTMIEQPFAPRDFLSHAALQQRIDTPICLDESIETVDDARTMLALGAGRIINIKVSRLGGLSPAQRVHDVAVANGIPVWCGGMHEFGIGRLANVAISALPGFTLPSDVSASQKYYARDIIVPPVTAHGGLVTVPTAPGLGAEVDEEFISANETASHRLTR